MWLEHFPERHLKIQVDVCVTGIGMVNTALQLGNLLAWEDYDLAINAGVAGSFSNKIKIGTTVQVKQDCFADFGVMNKDKFETVFETGLVNKNEPPFKNGMLKPTSIKVNPISKMKKVIGLTVNSVSGNAVQIKKLKKKFGAEIETMEGAAFFLACMQNNIPCLQIRSISNMIEVRNKKNWNIPFAVSSLNQTLIELLKNFNETEN